MSFLQELETQLNATTRGGRLRALLDADFDGVISTTQVRALLEGTKDTPSELRRWLASLARLYAVAEISSYRAGAVAEGMPPPGAEIGALYWGANIEFPGHSLALTVHAEQAAVINAWQNDETGVNALAVSASPCGYCRQFLNELTTAETMLIEIEGHDASSLGALLPLDFGPKDVPGTGDALLSSQRHGLLLDAPSTDSLVLAALDAANRSYAPYSKGFAGIALQVSSGAVFQGRYAENAAFNPSLPPLAAALSMRNMSASRAEDITRCVLVQNEGAIDHRPITSSLLQTIAKIHLEVWPASIL